MKLDVTTLNTRLNTPLLLEQFFCVRSSVSCCFIKLLIHETLFLLSQGSLLGSTATTSRNPNFILTAGLCNTLSFAEGVVLFSIFS